MPFRDHKGFTFSLPAASILLPFAPLRISPSPLAQVIMLGTNNLEPFGVNGEATAAVGDQVTIYGNDNIVKAKAIASLGVGAQVGVGSDNGRLGPGAAASGRFRTGIALEAAADTESFALFVSPRPVVQ